MANTSQKLDSAVLIDLSKPASAYDPMLFGQFLEHFHRQVYGGVFEPGSKLADKQGLRKDVIAALRELRIPVVRWPGGSFVSSYHWQNGVGPERTVAYEKARWCVEEPNTFGTDEFITWCRALGAEPYICANAGTGTAEEMSDWLEYCNLKDMGKFAKMRCANGYPEPHNVRYWSIGNEGYGFGKLPEQYAYFVRKSARLMRNVDPNIQLFAAACTDRDWTLPLLQKAGDVLNYVSIHDYWDPLYVDNNPRDYLSCMMESLGPDASIKKTREIIAEAGFAGQIDIAYDEWNLRGWHHPPGNAPEVIQARDKNDLNETYTMADAVFSASFLNTCLRHREVVKMANMVPHF